MFRCGFHGNFPGNFLIPIPAIMSQCHVAWCPYPQLPRDLQFSSHQGRISQKACQLKASMPHGRVYRLAPSQWETSLQSNGVSHWLGANLESALSTYPKIFTCPTWKRQDSTYRKISNIICTKSQSLNDSRLVLPLSFPNPLKPGVKSRMM